MTQRCEECGKRLRFFQIYTHPLDKNKVVCGKCLDLISQGLENYRKCLKEGKQHNVKCYFWDKKSHKCRNEKYLKKKTIN
jgi:hypothetical protein